MIQMTVDATDLLKAAGAQVDRVEKELIRELSHEGDEILKLFNQTVEHWDKTKFDKFKKTSKVTTNEATVEVSTTDRIYGFINNGTSKRYALLSGDWKSQTSVRSLVSSPGAGRVIARGRKAVPTPMPGIEGRHFDEEIVKVRQPIFVRNLEASAIVATKI